MSANRKVVFVNEQYYHVFNRGVEKRPTFTSKYEFLRAVDCISFYRYGDISLRYSQYLNLNKEKKSELINSLDDNQQEVEVIAFCLMGNHFHLLLKQIKEGGIVKFMAKFQNSYTKYFNTKHQRVGPLFQGVFKAVLVEDEEQLLHLSRYIHLNPVTGFRVKIEEILSYQWSSYLEYLDLIDRKFVNRNAVLNFFKDKDEYQKFVLDQADYAKTLERVEHLLID